MKTDAQQIPQKEASSTRRNAAAQKAELNQIEVQPVLAPAMRLAQRAAADIGSLSQPEAAALQHAVGMRAVQRLAARNRTLAQPDARRSLRTMLSRRGLGVQAKLTVGAANDPYEQEAERMANQALSGATMPADVARREDDGGAAQRRTGDLSGSFEAGAEVERALAQAGGGQPLPEGLRAELEPKYGADFSRVQVHTGAPAEQLNRAVGAQAFTHGQHIYMGAGKYSPGTQTGRRLLAHELTHVVQQGAAGVRRRTSIQRKLYVGGKELEETNRTTTNEQGEEEPVMLDITAGRAQQGDAVDFRNSNYREISGGAKITDHNDAWKKVLAADPTIKQMGFWQKSAMKSRLKKWMTRSDALDVKGIKAARVLFQKSEERRYESWADVAAALKGEQQAKGNKTREKALAKKIAKKSGFRNDLADALRTLHARIEAMPEDIKSRIWAGLRTYRAKFPHWWPRNAVKQRMANPILNKVSSNWVIIHEVMFFLAKSNIVRAFQKTESHPKQGTTSMPGSHRQTNVIGAGSGEAQGRHAVIEKNAWVKAARTRNMPLGAGASNTTDILMTSAQLLNLDARHKLAITWGAFVFWNKTYYQVEARGHTFHEIMDVANTRTGGEVDYDPDAVNPYEAGYNKKQQPQVTKPIDVDNVSSEQEQQISETFEQQKPEDTGTVPTVSSGPVGSGNVNQKGESSEEGASTSESSENQPVVVALPKVRDIYMVNEPIVVATFRGDKTIAPGSEVMVRDILGDQVNIETSITAGAHRGTVGLAELLQNCTLMG